MKLNLDLYADFICPWCFIGHTRLERIKQGLSPDIQLSIDMKPFLLYPQLPPGGVSKEVFIKYTKPGMGKSMRQEASVENIKLNYSNIMRIPNSVEAHRLVYLVRDPDIRFQLSSIIFKYYFEYAENIEDLDILTQLALSVNVNKHVIDQFRDSQKGKDEILAQSKQAREEMVTVVPSLKLENRVIIPGLQTAEVWEKYIRRIKMKREKKELDKN